jgi:hypothetical protein
MTGYICLISSFSNEIAYSNWTIWNNQFVNIQPYMLSTSSIFSYVVNRCFYCNVSFWIYFHYILSVCDRGRCDRDRMVVGFTTTYVIYLYSHKPLHFTIRYRDVQSHETNLDKSTNCQFSRFSAWGDRFW